VVPIKRTYFFALLLTTLAVVGTARAQSKIGFVASEAILDRLPDAKSARAKLSELQSGWMREIQRMEGEIDKAKADMQSNRLLWSAQEKRDAESRLADMESKLANYRQTKFGPKQEFERQQGELMGPVVDKVAKAIEDEAKAQKYDYVFDKSSRGMPMLYSNPSNDLTFAVLKRLGVDPSATDAASAPPPGGSPTAIDPKAEGDARRRRSGRNEYRPEPTDPNEVLQPNSPPPSSQGSVAPTAPINPPKATDPATTNGPK
jgi:outer membrane protein